MTERHSAVDWVLQFFTFEHLPPNLRDVSAPFAVLAKGMTDLLDDSPEVTAGLRKLLEAKDCFVRAAVAQPPALRPTEEVAK